MLHKQIQETAQILYIYYQNQICQAKLHNQYLPGQDGHHNKRKNSPDQSLLQLKQGITKIILNYTSLKPNEGAQSDDTD